MGEKEVYKIHCLAMFPSNHRSKVIDAKKAKAFNAIG